MNHSLYIRRRSKLYIEPGSSVLLPDKLLNLLANVEGLGYTLSIDVIKVVLTLSEDDFVVFYETLIQALKELVGAHVDYHPFYPEFPQQVVKMGYQQLYTYSFMHYTGEWINGHLLRYYPDPKKTKNEELNENRPLKMINLGSEEDFKSIFTALLSAKSSLSEQDRQDVIWYLSYYTESIRPAIPVEIPIKENVAILIQSLFRASMNFDREINQYVKTATDLLRCITALSEGDVSLAEHCKFRNFPKIQRRLFLNKLESITNVAEDMLRYPQRWKRIGEIIHPFEYKKRFPKTAETFDVIRNNKNFNTFNSEVEALVAAKKTNAAVTLLEKRPGELARRLDKLLRDNPDHQHILESFGKAVENIATPLILQLISYFKVRNQLPELRTFFPKGNLSIAKAIPNKLPPISETTLNQLVEICEHALIKRFSKLKPLGKVFMDSGLKNYTVPLGLRSASKALKTTGRGSRIDINPANDTIRFFIYWKDGKNRTDIDLSALALDDKHHFKTVISFFSLKSLGGYHSGDIVEAPNGASEFIDFSVNKFRKHGIRYVMMCINSFTLQPYCDLPVCFAGFMERQNPNSGEAYEPTTVENKFDLSANTRIAIPLIIDLVNRQVIWTDLSLKNNPSSHNTVIGNYSSLSLLNMAMTGMIKPNIYDLLKLHVKARGEEVFDKKQAITIFGLQEGIKPTDTDIILSEYL